MQLPTMTAAAATFMRMYPTVPGWNPLLANTIPSTSTMMEVAKKADSCPRSAKQGSLNVQGKRERIYDAGQLRNVCGT